jgi:coenzyme F420-0:L-glutamate ligase/coenzyme F420-1:gamma-L-glutamate ligase
MLTLIPVDGVPRVRPGDDLAAILLEAIDASQIKLADGDVLAVCQKVVSKAEGSVVHLADVVPSPFAERVAAMTGKDVRLVEVILRESRRIVRMDRGHLICETGPGWVCANAGVDASNVEKTGTVCLLPVDSDASASKIRAHLTREFGVDCAVIISDSFGRPWREGIVNFAIGCAGMLPLLDYTGQHDPAGYELRVTAMAVVDEFAAAAELAHGKLARVPVAIIRGAAYTPGEGTVASLIRDAEKDLFR